MAKTVSGPPPIVFVFQQESYEILESPEDLKNWEKMMKERVGFKADLTNVSGTCTESRTGGTSDDCDQD